MGKWYESDNPGVIQRGIFRTATFWIIAVLVLTAVISAGAWAMGVFTSDVAGKGEAIKQKNSALNRIGAQERFEDLYAQIKAADQRIAVAHAQYNTDSGNQTFAQNYFGIQHYCLGVIADYNANARKYTQSQFRSSDLPYQIDTQDPATDCKG